MSYNLLTSLAILILRVGLGIIFLAHGLQKTFSAFGGSGIEGLGEYFKSIGFSHSLFWAWIVALAEGICGLFLILGIFPRRSALIIAIIMLVAIIKVHAAKGFFMMQGGFEYQFLIIITCLTIILVGGGKFSLYDKL